MALKVVGAGFPLVVRAVLAMSRERVLIGIPADGPARTPDPDEPNPPSNAQIAYVMETGSPVRNIPARPFLMPGIANAQPAAIAEMKKAAVAALKDVAALKTTASNGGAIRDGLERVGQIGAAAVRQKMIDGPFVPLAGYTVAKRLKKGRNYDTPLIDTTQLYYSVTHRVEKK